MVATYPILSFLVILAVSLLVVRVGSVALRMTGRSPDVASFQAASAFSGAGYTTTEAEQAVSTPERRTVVKALIRLGNLGLVSVIASLVLSFTRAEGGDGLGLAAVVGGAVALVLLARSRLLNEALTPLIEWALSRTTGLDVRDYVQILGLQRGYRVAEIEVGEDDWLARDSPGALNLAAEGVVVLGIRRDGTYLGAPGDDAEMLPGDTVVVYGKAERLRELSGREMDDTAAHEDAVAAHERVLEAQEELVE